MIELGILLEQDGVTYNQAGRKGERLERPLTYSKLLEAEDDAHGDYDNEIPK